MKKSKYTSFEELPLMLSVQDKAGSLHVPEDVRLFFIPPYTPEMDPIEQIWKEIRKLGFRNEVFASLDKVVDRLCDTISSLTASTIHSITARSWISSCFN